MKLEEATNRKKIILEFLKVLNSLLIIFKRYFYDPVDFIITAYSDIHIQYTHSLEDLQWKN